MWHCWCRFPFEKKMRWIFKKKTSQNQVRAVHQFSNTILIYSEFMGFSRNGTEALMLMAAILPDLFFCAVYSWTPVSVKFYLYGNCSQKGWSLSGWLAQWLIRVKKFTSVRIGAIFLKTTSQTTTKIWKSGHGGFLRNLHFCSLDCNIAVRCCKLYIRQQDKRNVFDWGTREYDAK